MQEKFGDIITLISQDKNIDENTVIDVLKKILLIHASKQYGNKDYLQINFNNSGGCEIFIEREVVEDQNSQSFLTISLTDAKKRKSNIKIGEFVKEVLPFVLNNTQKIDLIKELQFQLKKAQKQKEYETFYDKIGSVLMGCVKNVDASESIISFTDHIGEVGIGSLKTNKTIKTDLIKYNNYIKVYVEDINQHADPQIILSRIHPNFLRELLKNEIPEIAEGLIEIKAIARDPGSLSKVAIHTNRLSINPIKICIGDRGSRIHNVIKELSGEKISFVLWNENINQFIANALSPATVLKITETKDGRYDVVVSNEDFSKAMGRGAQNVQLAKKLCNVKSITLLTEETEVTKYKELLEKQSKDLINNLQIEEMMAHLLISENFESAEIIANASNEEIAALNGFDLELADILIERAKLFIKQERENAKLTLKNNEEDISLFEIDKLSLEQINILRKNNILSASDLAFKDVYELLEIFDKAEYTMTTETASEIILFTRKKLHLLSNERQKH